jgi:type I restriction enzyme S subunit
MTRIRVPLGKFIKEYSERNKGNEDIPVYSVTNSQGFCTEYFGKEVASQDKTTYKIVPQGYFAYNPSRINVGSVDWQRYEKRVIVSPLYNVFSVSEGIDRQYLYYFLRSDLGRQMIKAKASGSVRDNLKLDMLKEMTIPDISVEQQKFCSSVLDKLHKLIQMRQQELQKLDEFIKARFVELFGDPVSNSYGLPEATLPDLGEFGRGVSKHRPRNDIKLLGGKYPLIQTGDVANAGLYITSYSSTYSELGLKQSKMWDKGTLCITIAANIAKTAILEFDACFPDSVVGFIANERTNNIFVHYWFSFFQAILESQAPESAQKNINLKILSELKVIVPEKRKQDQFASFVKLTDKSGFVERFPEFSLFYRLFSPLDSEMICIFPYFYPCEESAREIREIFI